MKRLFKSALTSRNGWQSRANDATFRRRIKREGTVPEDAAIVVTPAANPAGLGLVAFGLTTVLLSLVNAGVLPPGGEGVVIPLALAFGGLMQIFPGALEFRRGT